MQRKWDESEKEGEDKDLARGSWRAGAFFLCFRHFILQRPAKLLTGGTEEIWLVPPLVKFCPPVSRKVPDIGFENTDQGSTLCSTFSAFHFPCPCSLFSSPVSSFLFISILPNAERTDPVGLFAEQWERDGHTF